MVAADRSAGQAPAPGAAWDLHHPPERNLIDDCIHCGFCLPTCPTYVLWGEEMDSPRGRIQLMKMGLDGEMLTPEMAGHFDACLGCMACVTACPSGVRYDRLLESTRQQVERRAERPLTERAFRAALFRLFPYPRRLAAALAMLRAFRRTGLDRLVRRTGLLNRLPSRVRALHGLAPNMIPMTATPPPPLIPAAGAARARVGMLTGCVQRVLFDDVNRATARVLSAEGCEIVIPPDQRCCGALSMHAGREPEAQAFAHRLIDAFADARVDAIVVNAAGCGSTMKEYAHLLRDDPGSEVIGTAFAARVRDVTEFLAELEPVAPRHPLPLRAAYHDACHLAHAQGIRRQPRDVLASIPGVELVEVPEPEICCGSAGVYNLLEPDAAAELGERKARHLVATRAQAIVTANPGCTLQIQAHLQRLGCPMPVLHPVQVLDASIRAIAVPRLLGE
jgi:glycolate oxidase iron-sulfur subunit